MKKSLSCFAWAIVPTVSIFSYPIFHGIQSAMSSVEGLDAIGMAILGVATVLSALAAGFACAKENSPAWLPLAYLGYCLAAIVLALRFMDWSAPYHTTELYLTAIVFGCCLLAALLGTRLGHSARTLKEKKAA